MKHVHLLLLLFEMFILLAWYGLSRMRTFLVSPLLLTELYRFFPIPFQIGLVIDLTNTTRYYSPAEWTRQGIKHVKVRELKLICILEIKRAFPMLTHFCFRFHAREEMLYLIMNLLIGLSMR